MIRRIFFCALVLAPSASLCQITAGVNWGETPLTQGVTPFVLFTDDARSLEVTGNDIFFYGHLEHTHGDTIKSVTYGFSAGEFEGVPWFGPRVKLKYRFLEYLIWYGHSLGEIEKKFSGHEGFFFTNMLSAQLADFSLSAARIVFKQEPVIPVVSLRYIWNVSNHKAAWYISPNASYNFREERLLYGLSVSATF